jgi:hypothetical protein
MVNAGIHQDALKPSLQGNGDLHMPVFIKLMNIPEELGKTFIYDFLHLVIVVLITVTYLHSIAFQELIQVLLAVSVILPAAGY